METTEEATKVLATDANTLKAFFADKININVKGNIAYLSFFQSLPEGSDADVQLIARIAIERSLLGEIMGGDPKDRLTPQASPKTDPNE
jgi:hypothetical protein